MRGGADDDDGVLTSNPQERAQLRVFCFFFGDWFELLLSINGPEESTSKFKPKKKKKTCGNIKQTK